MTSSNKATSHDWLQLVSAVLEDGLQLLWKYYWWEKAKKLRTKGKKKRIWGFQNQILGKGTYADPQDQALYDEYILSLCHIAALNAGDRIQELGKIIESYNSFIQGQRKPIHDFIKIK